MMKRRYTTRPAPWSSALTAVVGVVILLIGAGEMRQAKEFHPFFLLWIAVGVCVVGYHLLNALTGAAPAQTLMEGDDTVPTPRPAADRLREADDLLARNMISPAEHEAKRREILKDV